MASREKLDVYAVYGQLKDEYPLVIITEGKADDYVRISVHTKDLQTKAN